MYYKVAKMFYILLRGVFVSDIKFLNSISSTVIDNNFIDNFMADAPSSVFSLIYIYAYRCAMANISVSNSDIAKKFNVIESDVIKAWKYWESVGLISAGDENGKLEDKVKVADNDFKKETAVTIDNVKTKDKKESPKVVTVRPVFSPTDINNIISLSPEVGEILKLAEASKGKTLSHKETEVVVWMYQELELPFDAILVLLNFCYQNNKPPRYMEKTAIDWTEKGIVTSEAASDYLSFYNNYGKVLKCFGVNDRVATAPERNNIDRWIKEWEMSFELIELAAKRTVENTGKAAFSYCNKILETWYKSGFKTESDVEKSEADYINKNSNRNVAKNNTLQQQPKGVFNNYNQKIYSPDEIAEILKRKGNA